MEINNKIPNKQSISAFNKRKNKYPDIITVTLTEPNANLKKNIIITAGKKKYRLDSVVLRDNMRNHFSCFVTLINKGHCFDGMSFSPINKCDWKTLLNKDEDFNHDLLTITFNFTKGFQTLFYYRIK